LLEAPKALRVLWYLAKLGILRVSRDFPEAIFKRWCLPLHRSKGHLLRLVQCSLHVE
jgi:hypothetical protein